LNIDELNEVKDDVVDLNKNEEKTKRWSCINIINEIKEKGN
jgi:hypothetical protein